VALLLAVIGGFVLARVVDRDRDQLDEPVPGEESVDVGFARDMGAHHAQAVQIADLLRDRTDDEDFRVLAADIALTQQAQIGMMQTWLGEWGLSPTGSQPRMAWMPDGGGTIRDGLMPGMATEAEMAQLRAATGNDFDLMFLRLMRQHHLGGIHMAQAAESRAGDGDVRALAETMVNGQQREITDMQALLARLSSS
jgi:uncharacterized protein (DUF305 family)